MFTTRGLTLSRNLGSKTIIIFLTKIIKRLIGLKGAKTLKLSVFRLKLSVYLLKLKLFSGLYILYNIKYNLFSLKPGFQNIQMIFHMTPICMISVIL